MCLHFIIYICCNPVFHLALCRLVYAVKERHMKRQLRMLMNKTWLLIPVCWADTEIEPLSAACQKFSWEVLHGSYKVENREFCLTPFSDDIASISLTPVAVFLCFASFLSLYFTLSVHFFALLLSTLLFLYCLSFFFPLLSVFVYNRRTNYWFVQFDSLHPILLQCFLSNKTGNFPPTVSMKQEISLVNAGVRVVA